MHACINDDVTCIQLLLYHGADLTLCDNSGMTALHFVAKSSRSGDAVTMLLNAGAPINVKCGTSNFTWYMRSVDRDLLTHQFTPLHFAALACNCVAVDQLLAYGADANLCDAKERTPLRLVMFFSQFVTIDHRDAFNRVRDALKVAEVSPTRKPFLVDSSLEQAVVPIPPTNQRTPTPTAPEKTVTESKSTVATRISPVSEAETKNESLDEIRKKLSGFRVAFSLQSEKLKNKLQSADVSPEDLLEMVSSLESRASGHIDSLVECIDNAIHSIDRLESREAARSSSDFALHRVFSFASSHIGAQKGLWRKLALELLRTVDGANVDDIVAYVWTHHTSEASACYELLIMWRIYTINHADHAARLKRALVEVSMSHDVIERIGLLARERLPPLQRRPTSCWSQQRQVTSGRRSTKAVKQNNCLFKTSCGPRRDASRQQSNTPNSLNAVDSKCRKTKGSNSNQERPDSSKSF